MDLKNLIKVYNNVISNQNCKHIIECFEERSDEVKFYDTPAYKFKQLDLNQTDLLPLAQMFAQQCSYYIEDYFKSLGVNEYIKIQSFEDVRIKKYEKNSDYQFKTHIDVADRESSIRYLVFILYLNDNNGYTSFPNLDYKFKPKRGSLVVFPPYWMFPHTGEIPTDYDKYIMMSSLHHL